MSFSNTPLPKIIDSESVEAVVANRSAEFLYQWLRSLETQIESGRSGTSITAFSQPVNFTPVLGQPVYFNSVSGFYEPALASVTTSLAGEISLDESAHVWGIVSGNAITGFADITVYGYVDLDVSPALQTGQTLAAGQYFLSSSEAGTLTNSYVNIPIPVLLSNGAGGVVVNPQFVNAISQHSHYSVQLSTMPAGTSVQPETGIPLPGVASPHSISPADTAAVGWLPASDAIFGGLAPAGAAFGYNLSQDPTLQALWPIEPLQHLQFSLVKDSPFVLHLPGEYEKIDLSDSTIVADTNGIWWMNDEFAAVPWPTYLVGPGPHVQGADNQLVMHFTKPDFDPIAVAVTRLRSDDARISITCAADGSAASVGSLKIALNLAFLTSDTGDTSGTAIKTFDSTSDTFQLGPVASGIRSLNTALTVAGASTFNDGSNDYATGLVTVDIDLSETRYLHAVHTTLDGATAEEDPVPSIGMSEEYANGFTEVYHVPFDIPAFSWSFVGRLTGRSAGSLPPLAFSYKIVPRPATALTAEVDVPAAYTPFICNTISTLSAAYKVIEARSEPLAAEPGDLIYIKVTRDGASTGDAYPDRISFLQRVLELTPAAAVVAGTTPTPAQDIEVVSALPLESIGAGAAVHVFRLSGVVYVRNADNSQDLPADGYTIDASVNSATPINVYTDGLNIAAALIPGVDVWTGQVGGYVQDLTQIPSTGFTQYLGKANENGHLPWEADRPVYGTTDATGTGTGATSATSSGYDPVIGTAVSTLVAGMAVSIDNTNPADLLISPADYLTDLEAEGYILENYAIGDLVTVHQTGLNTAVVGLPGVEYVWLGSNGGYITSPPVLPAMRHYLGQTDADGDLVWNPDQPIRGV